MLGPARSLVPSYVDVSTLPRPKKKKGKAHMGQVPFIAYHKVSLGFFRKNEKKELSAST